MKQNKSDFVTYPTWGKYIVISRVIESMTVRDKRIIFQIMRTFPDLTHNSLLGEYGITAGEFSMWQILSEQRRPRKRKQDV